MKVIHHPAETRQDWSKSGPWKCVCSTPTHKRGQRFTAPQCSYCIPVESPKETA